MSTLSEECRKLEKENEQLREQLKFKDDLIFLYDPPKKETKLEIGKWYKIDSGGGYLMNYSGNEENNYGFWSSTWREDLVFQNYHVKLSNLATKEELKEILIPEAKKRGFKKGVKCNYPYQNSSDGEKLKREIEDLYFYTDGRVTITDGSGHCLLYKGKWATIIEEKAPVIAGYKMEVEGEYIKFGCALFHENRLKELNKVCQNWELLKNEGRNNRTIKSITLSSDIEMTTEQLKDIVESLHNKNDN